MPIYRTIQHSIYCENNAICFQFEDFADITARYMTMPRVLSPAEHYKKKGWRKIDGKWYCPECAKIISQPHQ